MELKMSCGFGYYFKWIKYLKCDYKGWREKSFIFIYTIYIYVYSWRESKSIQHM